MIGNRFTRKVAKYLEAEAMVSCQNRQEREEDEFIRQQMEGMDAERRTEYPTEED